MSQFVLLVLREGEAPRIVGPFLSELTAQGLAGWSGLREGEFLIQPLEPPPGPAERGRHSLIPSPYPRDLKCEACGNPYLPTHSIAAPGPTTRHPFRAPSGHHADVMIVDDVLPADLAREVDQLAVTDRRPEYFGQLRPEPGRCTKYRNLSCSCEARNQPCWRLQATSDWEKKKAVAARDLAAGGRPITSWIEAHADQLRRFAPPELPQPPKEIEP